MASFRSLYVHNLGTAISKDIFQWLLPICGYFWFICYCNTNFGTVPWTRLYTDTTNVIIAWATKDGLLIQGLLLKDHRTNTSKKYITFSLCAGARNKTVEKGRRMEAREHLSSPTISWSIIFFYLISEDTSFYMWIT